jgi:alpha-1,2-mannosyltransferase
VRETLWFGQVNLILMAMVTADCLLRRTPWPRGLLIGLAAAVKLTPAVFVLFFLPRREWKPPVTALATFVGASVLGAVLAPSVWGSYWLGVLLEPDRIGGAGYAGNQSLRGTLHRLALPHSVETITWLALVAATVAAGWVAVLRLRRAGRDVEAMLVVAAVGLLCSPISWSHHWVWAVPALVVLAAAWVNRRVRWTTAALAAVFLVGPHWLFPKGDDRELSLDLWQQVILDTYVVVAIVGVAVMVWRGAPTTVAVRRAVLSPE